MKIMRPHDSYFSESERALWGRVAMDTAPVLASLDL
jgi:hypothetical protein